MFTQQDFWPLLAVLENDSVIYLNQVDNSTRVIKMRNSVGLYAPLHCTAMGKVMMAFADVDIKELELPEYTPNTLLKHRYLIKESELIQSRGYAIESEEYEYGLSSAAVPVFNKENEFICGIGISGLSARLSKEKLHEIGVILSRLVNDNSLM